MGLEVVGSSQAVLVLLQWIVQQAYSFAQQHAAQFGGSVTVTINPGLYNPTSSPAVQAFFQALQQLCGSYGTVEAMCEAMKAGGVFAWHGTDLSSLVNICRNSWNVNCRKCGIPAEFFGATPSVSLGYTKGGQHLILAFLLPSGFLSRAHGHVTVANPLHSSERYCLPVAVVSRSGVAPPGLY
ncbi:unnamed protein product [Vitrella brassicaformis CCMP3155]|uniref:Uncharacterized protein n=1 Tax=Vitrella brassicaformis (strain CCMP3155) TaxID=1169540 RepID=A0A0G4EKR9_VITBC|nr:unnamed protein product [Vitrella brassicaformis CCMP3155]|eukprot:CEL97756.1 unnamed protein product [Vitrella brassicaformis CCMP3155]